MKSRRSRSAARRPPVVSRSRTTDLPRPRSHGRQSTQSLVASIDAALEALPNIGTGGVATAVGTATAGIGTFTVTFSGANLAKRAVNLMTSASSLTGTLPTLAVTETTPGVNATALGIAAGGLLIDTTNKKLYINTGTPAAPTWTVVGSQS